MKKFISYFILVTLIAIYGCESKLDQKPFTYYDQEFTLNTEEGMNALLNGTYSKLKGQNYYGRLMFAFEGAKGADFFVRLNSGSRFERECRYSESSVDNGYANLAWTAQYEAIRTATILLENIDKISGNAENLKRIKGEAKALRALTYFDLMRLFAYPPIFSVPGNEKYGDNYKWGVPIINSVEQGTNIFTYIVKRELATVTFDFIETELKEAISLLNGLTSQDGHINYIAASALLMRLHLYKGEWEKVIQVGEGLAASVNNKYRYLNYDAYKTSYYKAFNPESVWEISYSITDNLGGESLNGLVRKPTYDNPGADNDGMVAQTNGYAAYGLSNSAIDLLKKHPKDVRSYLICDLGIINRDYKGYRKYVGDTYHFVHNIPIVRLPEIHLTLAEAYAQKEDYVNAELYYNKLREARTQSFGFTATSKSGIINEILDERRRELMLEGHTFWDYFRTGRVLNREVRENVYSSTAIVIFGNKVQVVYPIPLAEMEANADIRDQQNPGYSAFQ